MKMKVADIIKEYEKKATALEEHFNSISSSSFDEGLERWKDYFGFLNKEVEFVE